MKSFYLFLSLLLPIHAQTCLDFEDFQAGATTTASTESISFDTTFLAEPLVNLDGDVIAIGNLSVGSTSTALGGTGQSLNASNAAVKISLAGIKEVSFRFSNQGGYLNFSVGDEDPVAVDNETGTYSSKGITVEFGGNTNGSRLTGIATFSAEEGSSFDCFSIGGQELQIDDICFLTCENPRNPEAGVEFLRCIEFEGLKGAGLEVGESYTENDLHFKVIEHLQNFTAAKGSGTNRARHLGQEFFLEDAGVAIDPECLGALSFLFSSERSVTITINGESKSLAAIALFDEDVIGGVTISVAGQASGGAQVGTVALEGLIEDFSISGESLYLDHFCAAGCRRDCIDFEGEVAGAKYEGKEMISEDGYDLLITDPAGSGEPAQISADNLAQGGGNELALTGGGIAFGKRCWAGLAFQYAQRVDGVAFEIDTNGVQVARMRDLDGQTIGNMTFEVVVTQAAGSFERGVVRLSGDATEITLIADQLSLDVVCLDLCPDDLVLGFEELPVDVVFEEGEVLEEDGLEIEVGGFRTNDEGTVTVVPTNNAGGLGQEIQLNEASLVMDFLCASQVSFLYANQGGDSGPQGFGFDVRLVVNGESSGIVQDFTELNGETLGGSSITVSNGRVTVSGEIEGLIIGGLSLSIDSITQTPFQGGPFCYNLNTVPLGVTYGIFEENFLDLPDNNSLFFNSFINLAGDFVDGTATVSTSNEAGGSGRELLLSGSSFILIPTGNWSGTSFRFRNTNAAAGHQVQLSVNGSQETRASIFEFDNMTFGSGDGAVTVRVLSLDTRPEIAGGIIKIDGTVRSLTIGGQGIAIDDLCGTQLPAPVLVGRTAVQTQVSSPGMITYIWDMEVLNAEPSDFILRESSDLGDDDRWSSISASQRTVVTHGGNANLYRIETTQPTTAERKFYRILLSPN